MSNTGGNGTSAGSGFASKIKGAGQVVHGIGETIRGTAMDTVDALGGSKNREKNAATTEKGRSEFEGGMNNLDNRATAPTHQTTNTTNADARSGVVGTQRGPGVTGEGQTSGPGQEEQFGTSGRAIPPGATTGGHRSEQGTTGAGTDHHAPQGALGSSAFAGEQRAQQHVPYQEGQFSDIPGVPSGAQRERGENYFGPGSTTESSGGGTGAGVVGAGTEKWQHQHHEQSRSQGFDGLGVPHGTLEASALGGQPGGQKPTAQQETQFDGSIPGVPGQADRERHGGQRPWGDEHVLHDDGRYEYSQSSNRGGDAAVPRSSSGWNNESVRQGDHPSTAKNESHTIPGTMQTA